jgi:hypothetical protein
MNKICFFSSFIFITNIIYNLLNKQYTYAFLFSYLLVTSLIIHYYEGGLWLNLLDKTAIIGILVFSVYNYGNIVFKNYQKIKKSFRSSTRKAFRKLQKNKHIETYLNKTPKTSKPQNPQKPQNRILFKNKKKTGITLFVLLFLPLAFLFEIYLYYYGYIKCKYCYDTNKLCADMYHSLLHLVACISFNLLTYILI